jgi:hypothetical protein
MLARHRDIDLFMQPFNGGSVREKMYQIWDDELASEEDVGFFFGLEKGQLNREYIKSHWFDKYSTTKEFIPGQLHVVKTTLNHFLVDWCQQRFPMIHQWAIWRNPWAILSSLIRNDLISAWYDDALIQVQETVSSNEILRPIFGRFNLVNDHAFIKAAYLIAVRSYYLFYFIDPAKVIYYNRFREDPNKELSSFLDFYGLERIEFDLNEDLNIVGEYNRAARDEKSEIEQGHQSTISSIFAPLYLLKEEKLS